MNELIRLSQAFNEMTTGLARRVVRDAITRYIVENHIETDIEFRGDKIARVIYREMKATIIIELD